MYNVKVRFPRKTPTRLQITFTTSIIVYVYRYIAKKEGRNGHITKSKFVLLQMSYRIEFGFAIFGLVRVKSLIG